VLGEALSEIRPHVPFTADSVQHIGKEQLRLLDQIAFRFMKLQDSMGQKLLPTVLELAQEPIAPDATFAEKLNWLERIGAIASAEEWKRLRVARNAIAHEYPEDPTLRAAGINRFLDGASRLTVLYESVRQYVRSHFPPS